MSARFARTAWPIVRMPLLAFAALCGLLCVTIALAYVPMGALNLAVSLAIATIKVLIIVVVFMELAKSSAVIRLAAFLGVLWLTFLFVLIFVDYQSR